MKVLGQGDARVNMPISQSGDISASHFYPTLQSPPWREVLCIQVLLHFHLYRRDWEDKGLWRGEYGEESKS